VKSNTPTSFSSIESTASYTSEQYIDGTLSFLSDSKSLCPWW